MKDGKFVARQRDCRKIRFEDMSATEQQALERFETQKARRQYEETHVRKPPYFNSKMM